MKIKQIAKYLLPIVLVVGIVVAFLLSRMSQPSGRDNVLTGDVELPQDQEGNYIAQRYESNLIPSDTGYTVDGQPVDNVIRVDDGESGKDSEYIYIEIADTDVKELHKKEDLLDGHPTTDHTTQLTSDILHSKDLVPAEEINGNMSGTLSGVPTEIAYDTAIVKRNSSDGDRYIGMLYGKWTYNFSVEYQQAYNITTELVIASHYNAIVLDSSYTEDAVNQLVLTGGSIATVLVNNEENLHGDYIGGEMY